MMHKKVKREWHGVSVWLPHIYANGRDASSRQALCRAQCLETRMSILDSS